MSSKLSSLVDWGLRRRGCADVSGWGCVVAARSRNARAARGPYIRRRRRRPWRTALEIDDQPALHTEHGVAVKELSALGKQMRDQWLTAGPVDEEVDVRRS